jgi:hypothetical protein
VPTLSPDSVVCAESTEADRLAAHNRAANIQAISRTQPALIDAIRDVSHDLSWIFARDGSLTGYEPGDRWYGGCSVPLLAARATLKSFEPGTGVACFLSPSHAAHVRVALARLGPSQALICVIPDLRVLDISLHCDDFSDDLTRGRLWFAWGEQWPRELTRLLDGTPGLPTPSRFIRLPLIDSSLLERLIGDAQRAFGEVSARRAAAIASMRARWAPRDLGADAVTRNLCVLAPSTFRLWDDAGDALYAALTSTKSPHVTWRRFDPDAPAASSPLALASAAAESDGIVAADLSRADVASLAPDGLPWITWVTAGRIPPVKSGGPRDALLLADPAWRDSATAAGWPAERIAIAAWPAVVDHNNPARGPTLALISDTHSLDAPESLAEYSSHCLLWEKLRRDVLRDPLVVPADVQRWVRDRAKQQGIAAETIDATLFVTRLIIPAYQQALADLLLSAGIPVQLYGAGWGDLPRFQSHAAGTITSREQLRAAARGATALIHAWPSAGARPIDSLGRPVVRPHGRGNETFLREAKLALEAEPNSLCRSDSTVPISPGALLELLDRVEARRATG